MEKRGWFEAVAGGVVIQLGLAAIFTALGGGLDTTYSAQLKEDPIEFLAASSVGVPLIEELLFRWVPLYIWPGASMSGGVALLSTVAFAGAHGFAPDVFLKGCFYWYLARKYGVPQAVVGHSVTNLTFFGLLAATTI